MKGAHCPMQLSLPLDPGSPLISGREDSVVSIPVIEIGESERAKVLATEEGHFSDVKRKEIAPSKLTNTLAAFSNAEGGEVYIGVAEDKATHTKSWAGFATPEDANAHLQIFEQLFPLGEGYAYTFLKSPVEAGYVLKVDVAKSRDVKKAWDGQV